MSLQTVTSTCDIHHTNPIAFNFPYNVGPVVATKTIPLEKMSRGGVLGTAVTPMQRGYRETPTSPTVCKFRIAWNQIFPWPTYPEEVFDFMNALTPEELDVVVDPNNTVAGNLEDLALLPLPTSDGELMLPAQYLFFGPHNRAANPIGAAHQHAMIAKYAPSTFPGLAGDPDCVFMDDCRRVVGIIELKTFWSVDARQIDEVFSGNNSNWYCSNKRRMLRDSVSCGKVGGTTVIWLLGTKRVGLRRFNYCKRLRLHVPSGFRKVEHDSFVTLQRRQSI